MTSLTERMLGAGSIKSASTLDESAMFKARDIIPTELPILNIAFSGDINGGLVPGLTVLAGESKTFKTLLGLYCMKAYFNKYPESIALVYDSEFSLTPDYMASIGIDTSRVIHIPIEHIEQMKFDITKRLEEVKRGDKVFILVDSLGAMSSKKEVDDALSEKSVADMTRAKAIRSMLRLITPHLTIKDIPAIVINHVYSELSLYPKTIVGGGTAVMYTANQVFIISKAQEKDSSGTLLGYKFTITTDKSRFVKEKSRLPFIVTYKGGIEKYSGLLDIAVELGYVDKPKKGYYQSIDPATGEVLSKELKEKATNNADFWGPLLANNEFVEAVKKRYKLTGLSVSTSDVNEEV